MVQAAMDIQRAPKSGTFQLYGRTFPIGTDRFVIERECIRQPDKFPGRKDDLHHYREALTALLPKFEWHRWSELLFENFVKHDQVAICGPGSSGKTYTSAAWAYLNFQIWLSELTCLVSTTTRDLLPQRVWGEICGIHRAAKEIRPWLDGHITDANYSLTVAGSVEGEGRSFKGGIKGVACKVGPDQWTGMSNYVGVKNERLLIIMDELSLMGSGAIDAMANLATGGAVSVQFIGMGNPKDPLDSLGKLGEPVGGWSAIGQEKRTRTWPTRDGGVGIQIYGPDTPNGDFPRGVNPWHGILKPETIERKLAYYKDANDINMTMMYYGIMPVLSLDKRVLTMQLCEDGKAFNEVTWSNTPLKKVAALDPGKVADGDRKIFTIGTFGEDVTGAQILKPELQVNIPIVNSTEDVDTQIVKFVMKMCVERGIPPENFGYDSTGNATLASEFAHLWNHKCVPIDFGGNAPDRPVRSGGQEMESQAYRNRVTGLWFAVREAVKLGQVRGLPRDCAQEGCQRIYRETNKVGGVVQVQVEPKDDMKERTKESPDLMDSFVILLEMARRHGFQLGQSKTTPQRSENPLLKVASRMREMLRSKDLTPISNV